MAEESKLGFDASNAIRTLELLVTGFKSYNQTLNESATQSQKFNKTQSAFEKALVSQGKAAQKAAQDLLALAAAQKKADDAAKAAANNAKTAAKLDARRRSISISRQVSSQLLPDRGTASLTQLVNFDKATAAFQKLVATSSISAARVQTILRNLSGEYTGAERKVRDAIVGMIQAQSKLGGNNTSTLNASLRNLGITGFQATNQLRTGLAGATQQSNALGLSWQSVGRIFVGQAIFRVVSQISSEIKESVDRARELQIALGQIQTIAPPDLKIAGPQEIGRLTRELSNSFGIDQVEAARAVYEGFSSQLGDTAETMKVLEASARLAITTNSDLATTQAVVGSALNAYALDASNAERVTNLLFTTIDVSAAKMGDFEGAIGRVFPTANALGVEMQDLLQAFSAINIQGTDADTSFTQLLNLFKGLIKPTEALKAKFQELGIAGAEAGIARFGFVGFLQELTKSAGSVQELGKLFDDVREIQGALALLGESGSKQLAATAKDFNSSAEVVRDAFKFIDETPAQQLQKSIERFKNVMTDDLGNGIINALNKIIAGFGGAEAAAAALVTVLKNSLVPVGLLIGGVVATGLATATIALVGMASAAAAVLGPVAAVGAVLAGIFGAAVGIEAVNKLLFGTSSAADKIVNSYREADKALAKFNETVIKEQQKQNTVIKGEVDKTTSAIIESINRRVQATNGIRQQVESVEKLITENLKGQLRDRESSIKTFLDKTAKMAEDAKDKIKKSGEDLRDFQNRVNQGRFERNVDAAKDDPGKQASLLKQRTEELKRAAAQAAKLGDFDQGEKFLDDALQVAERLASITGQRAQGEAVINGLLRARKSLADSEINSIKNTVAEAAKKAPQLEEEATKISSLIDLYEQLSSQLKKGDLTGDARANVETNLKSLATQLQNALQNFVKLAPKGIADDLLQKIPAEFRGIDGLSAPLDLTVDSSLKSLQDKLNQTRLTMPVELQVQNLTGVAAGPGQLNALQAKIAQLGTQLKTNLDNSATLIPLNNDIDSAKRKLDDLFSTLKKEAALPKIDLTTGDKEFQASVQKNAAFLQQQAATFQTNVMNAVANAIKTGSVDEVNAQIEKATNFAEANKGNSNLSGFVQTIDAIKTTLATFAPQAQSFKTALDASVEAQNTKAALDLLQGVLSTAQTNAEATGTSLKALGPAGEAGANQAVAGLNAINAAAVNAKASVDALNAAQAGGGGGGGTTQNKSRGGLMHFFSNGGFAPRGTDTIPAMLSPGEFVVNAAATRRFYSELVAINSNRSPVYRADGGIVNNNQFGDININLPKGTSEEHARSVVRKINRASRRGSARIR